jgi:hypothetical protein
VKGTTYSLVHLYSYKKDQLGFNVVMLEKDSREGKSCQAQEEHQNSQETHVSVRESECRIPIPKASYDSIKTVDDIVSVEVKLGICIRGSMRFLLAAQSQPHLNV